MKRVLLSAPGIILALYPIAAGWSQSRPNGPYLTTPLTISSGYDDNFVVDAHKFDDTVTLLTLPTLAWRKSTHQTRFSLDYEPEFELFARNTNLDAWNHSAVLRVNQRLNGRMSVDAGNLFLSTMDPSRRLGNSLLLLPRGHFLQNAFYTELGYRLDHRTKLSFRLDNAVTTTGLKVERAGRLDQVSAGGSVSLEHNWDRHHSLTGNYGYVWVRPFDTKVYGTATGVHVLNAGYAYSVNPGLLFRLAAGVVRGHPSGFTGGAAVEKKLGGVWVAGGYRRYLSFFGGFTPAVTQPAGTIAFAEGFAPNSIYQVTYLRSWGNITSRLSLEGSIQRALIGETAANRGIKGGVAQLRMDYKLTGWFSVFTSMEFYGQNLNEFTQIPLSRRRYFGGVKIVLTRPPEPENPPRRRGIPPEEPRNNEHIGEGEIGSGK